MPPKRPPKPGKRKPNKGSFRPVAEAGPDPRRYTFSTQDCRVGYWVACIKHPHLREWIQLKVRLHRRAKESRHGPEETNR